MDLHGVPFTKVYRSMLTSSIWTTPHPQLHMIRCVWVTLMLLADKHGYVHASVPGLAAQAMVSLEEAEAALAVFRAPDPYSRTKEHEGRRLVDVDGGWLLLNYSTHRDATREELTKQSKRDWYHRNKGAPKTREEVPNESSPRTLEHQPSVSVSEISPDQSLAGPDQGESPPASEQPTSEPFPEAQGGKAIYRNLDGFVADEELIGEAIAQGLTREEFTKYLDDARDGPIGGQRGTFSQRRWVQKQLPRWRTWAEEARSRAVHRSGSTGGGSGGSGRGPRFAPVLEPREKHRRVAKKFGVDLDAIVREVIEQNCVETLGTGGALEQVEKRLARACQAKIDSGEVPDPRRKGGGHE